VSAVDRVLEHVEGVQEKGNGFWALCPAHDDHNPTDC
jgi:DNA primase